MLKPEYYTPAQVGRKLGTSGQLVRLSILHGLDGWADVKYFMCGRNMKIPAMQFEQWFDSEKGENIRTRLQNEVNHRSKKEKPEKEPAKVRAVKVRAVKAKRR